MLGDRQRGTGTKRALQARETRVNLRLNTALVTDSFLAGIRPGKRSAIIREALKLYIDRELRFGKEGGAVIEQVIVPVKPVPVSVQVEPAPAKQAEPVVEPVPAPAKPDETPRPNAVNPFLDKTRAKGSGGLIQAGRDWV